MLGLKVGATLPYGKDGANALPAEASTPASKATGGAQIYFHLSPSPPDAGMKWSLQKVSICSLQGASGSLEAFMWITIMY